MRNSCYFEIFGKPVTWTGSVMATGLLFLTGGSPATPVQGEDEVASLLDRAEIRLRSIYEKGEFRAKRFPGEWHPDSSGYVVMERIPEKKKEVPVFYEVDSGERRVMEPGEQAALRVSGGRSPDGKSLVVEEQGRLKVRDRESGEVTTLTETQSGSAVSHGRAAWSPDSRRVSFVETDASQVRLRPMLVPGDPSYPKVREVRFARVGGKIPELRVGVVDAGGGEISWLPLPAGEEGFYLGDVEWAGNSQELVVEKLSRFRDEREFFLFDVETGKRTRIFHETDPAWVVASYGKNLGWEWLKDGKEFLVLSEKGGWRQAYVHSRDGSGERLLTPGDYDVIEKGPVDEEGGWFYFYASPENATRQALYRVPLDGSGTLERVTPEDQPGFHTYRFSPDLRWAFHTRSSLEQPPVTELVTLPDHRSVRLLEDNRALREKIASLPQISSELLTVDIGDGVEMDAWMLKPPGFDPGKKYPVLVYVYGEPHSQTVLDRWGNSSSDYHRAVAELGYLVVSIDNRGTPAPKGAAWRRAVFGSLGPLSTEEQARGLRELARKRPYLDLSRVGIWGWSGGGSNTLNAMFRKPELYHVGIAVVPKPQPHLYNAWFQEIYMETRETNPGGYETAAAINYAEGLGGDLLIIHGTGETNTHLEIVEGLVDRLIELGKPFDYMAYPNRNHGISEGKGTSLHMRMLMVRYLLDHLRPGGES